MDKTEDKSEKKAVDPAILSDETKEKIRQKVEKNLAAEAQKKLEAEYEAALVSEAKRKQLLKDAKPGETADGLVPIFIDLPKVSECIRLDGVAFYPERTYNVLPAVRETILEIMGRGEAHEDEVNGRKDSNAARKRTQKHIH